MFRIVHEPTVKPADSFVNRNPRSKMEIAFKDDDEATRILELARYANVHNQKPLVEEEMRFIAKHPDIARKILTMNPLR